MSVVASSNLERFDDAITRYIRELKVEPAVALRKQGRLLFDRVAKLTPPRSQSQGKRAVKRDVERAVQPITSRTFTDPSVKTMVRRRDYAGLHAFAERASGGRWDIVPFSEKLHQDARDSRGRVRSGTGLLTPDADKVRAYVRKLQERVGMGRGGWAPAVLGLGGSASAWFAKWSQEGEFRDSLANPVAGYLRSDNKSPWANRGDDERVVSSALRSRAFNILSSIEKAIERAGKDMK